MNTADLSYAPGMAGNLAFETIAVLSEIPKRIDLLSACVI